MGAKSLTIRERQAYKYVAGSSRQGTDLANLVDGNFLGLSYHDATVTSAQILALDSVFIEIVPPPGAGKILVYHSALFKCVFNTTAYVENGGGTSLGIYTTTGTQLINDSLAGGVADSFTTATADFWAFSAKAPGQSGTIPGNVNDGFSLRSAGAGPLTTGDSDWYIRTFYSVVDETLP